MRRLSAAFIIVIFFVSGFIGGAVARPFSSLTKGNDWRGFPEFAQGTYLAGFLDAMGLMQYGHDQGQAQQYALRWSSILDCLESRKMTLRQAYDVVNKWMGNNPDKLNWNMSVILNASFGEICPFTVLPGSK